MRAKRKSKDKREATAPSRVFMLAVTIAVLLIALGALAFAFFVTTATSLPRHATLTSVRLTNESVERQIKATETQRAIDVVATWTAEAQATP